MEQPQVDQNVTIEYVDEGGVRTIFEGFVAECHEDRFLVSLAKSDASLEADDQVRVRYSDTKGLCFFSTKVLRVVPGNRVFASLANPLATQRSQRRRFMRLNLSVPASCVRLDAAGGAPEEECRTSTLELGGNGAGILADRPFAVGERVRLRLDLGSKWGSAEGVATVKRSVPSPQGPAEHRVALQFIDIDAKSQARILSFLVAARAEGRAT